MQEHARKAEVWYEEYQRAKGSKEKEAVLKKFETYLKLYPQDSATRYVYIILLMSEDRIEEALQQVEECLLHNPTAGCIILKAKILNSIGCSREACKFIEQVKQYLVGAERMELEVTELLALINARDYEKALSLLREIGKENLLQYANENPERAQNVIDILNELEAYERGILWAKENKSIIESAKKIAGRFYDVLAVIPKVEGDWEVPDRPVLYVEVAVRLTSEDDIQEFVKKERKVLNEFFKEVPLPEVRLVIEPVEVESGVSAY